VCEQNRLLSVCFGLPAANKHKTGVGTAHRVAYVPVCDKSNGQARPTRCIYRAIAAILFGFGCIAIDLDPSASETGDSVLVQITLPVGQFLGG
jgi:hypothetical protein